VRCDSDCNILDCNIRLCGSTPTSSVCGCSRAARRWVLDSAKSSARSVKSCWRRTPADADSTSRLYYIHIYVCVCVCVCVCARARVCMR
jgi:hypothetical protein